MIVIYSMPEGEGSHYEQPKGAEQQPPQESAAPSGGRKTSESRTRGEPPQTGDRGEHLRLNDVREEISNGDDIKGSPEITPGPIHPEASVETEEEQKIRAAFEKGDGEALLKALKPDGQLEQDPGKLAAAARIAEELNKDGGEKVDETVLIDNLTKMGINRDKMRQLVATQFKGLVDEDKIEQLIKDADVSTEDDQAVKPSPEMDELEAALEEEDFEKLQAIIGEAPQNPEEAEAKRKEVDEYVKTIFEKYGPKVFGILLKTAVAAGIAFLLSYCWLQTKLGSGGGGRGGH